MTTPSWPQLLGWLRTAQVTTASGRWRERDDRGGQRQGTFAHRAPDDWQVLDGSGALTRDGELRSLWRDHGLERGDDYHRAFGPVEAVEHDGRPAWQVRIEPPPRKSGLLTYVVDDETGLLLRQANDDHGLFTEVLDLELGVDLPEEAFAAARAERAERVRRRELSQLVLRHPPPTPQWFLWRRSYVEAPDCREVTGGAGSGTVGRAPLAEQAPVSEFSRPEHVLRLDHGGWSWAVASDRPMTAADARAVVEQVVEDADG